MLALMTLSFMFIKHRVLSSAPRLAVSFTALLRHQGVGPKET